MIKKITDFIAFRTTKRYNVIKIRSLKPNYYDKDTILLHAVMQLVVDYVEIELASEEENLINKIIHAMPYLIRLNYRNKKLGTKRLNTLIELEDTDTQWKTFYTQIKKVYTWWTEEYINREDIDDIEPLEREKMYYNEDEEMLKTVIEYRQYMWT